jgi:predicted DNA-binding transcriptional regulator AlpA
LRFKVFLVVSSWEKAGGFNMYCDASGTVIRGAMRAKECARFLGIGVSTFWRWEAKGIVPKGIRLTPRCTVWPVEVLQALLSRQNTVRGKKINV